MHIYTKNSCCIIIGSLVELKTFPLSSNHIQNALYVLCNLFKTITTITKINNSQNCINKFLHAC